MHANGVSHRDLKLDNILLDDDFNLKIVDFGFASIRATNTTHLGSFTHMAPEIWEKDGYNGFNVDIFAVGVILFYMVAGHPPFGNSLHTDPYYKPIRCNRADQFWKIHSQLRPKEEAFSESFKNLVTLLLNRDPVQRPSYSEIKFH